MISIISFVFIDVNAAIPETTIKIDGVTKGTTDPDSYMVIEPANLTINNISSSDSFKAYKIIASFYNPMTDVVTYEFTSNFKTFLAQSNIYKALTISDYYNLTSGDITSGSTQTSSTLDKLVSKYATYIYNNSSITGTSMSVSGTKASASLESGVYLVLPTSTQRVYSVMVENLTPTAVNGTWQVNDFTINAKVSDPAIIKYIGKIGQNIGSYSIGDYVPCILVGTVPSFPTNSDPFYIMIDAIGDIFDVPSVTDFTIEYDGKALTANSNGWVYDESGKQIAHIESPSSRYTSALGTTAVVVYLEETDISQVVVKYNLKLNNNAIISNTGNVNNAGMIIKKYAYGPDDGNNYMPYYTQVTVYTYGIDLLAYKKGDKSTTLSDMTFEVYKDSSLTQKVGTITTDSAGKGTLAGVAEGTYYIKNTKAKTGYNLATTTSMKVKISGSVASTTDGYYKVEIEVPEAKNLPLTGGSGIIIYIGIGLLLITISTLVFLIYEKSVLHNSY